MKTSTDGRMECLINCFLKCTLPSQSSVSASRTGSNHLNLLLMCLRLRLTEQSISQLSIIIHHHSDLHISIYIYTMKKKQSKQKKIHTSCFDSLALSPMASLAALARVPMDASLSFATSLLASFEVPLMPCWTVSAT